LRGRKKININVQALKKSYPQEKGAVRLFFEDEASFARVSTPKHCWAAKGVRPVIQSQGVLCFVEVFGAVEPETGDFFYKVTEREKPIKKKAGRRRDGETAETVMPKLKEKGRKSRLMNEFMQKLCDKYPNDLIILVCDNAGWHKSQYTVIPERLTLLHIPPYTPEMNPIEQLWREIRTSGFYNKYFDTIEKAKTNLRVTINKIPIETIKSITQRKWIMECVKSDSA